VRLRRAIHSCTIQRRRPRNGASRERARGMGWDRVANKLRQ
jgi:hypothetical protein